MFLDSTSRDFDSLAEGVVAQFLTSAVPLQDAIVKVAYVEDLAPEEVRRVVEKVNTLATVQMVKTAKNGSLEFDLADYNTIVGLTHPEGVTDPAVQSTSKSTTQPLTMPVTAKIAKEKANVFDRFFGLTTKTAKNAAPEKRMLSEVFTLKHKIESLGRQKVAAELSFKKATDKMLSDFSSLYGPDFTKFANEIYTLYGEPSRALLNGLAGELRTKVAFEKVAYVIDDMNQPQIQDYNKAHQAVLDVIKSSTELDAAKKSLDTAWAKVKSRPTMDTNMAVA